MKLKVLYDIKPVINSNRFSENLKLSHKKETIINTLFTFYLEIERSEEKDFSDILPDPKGDTLTMNTINS